MKHWPPSNYPIFIALILLVATAVALAVGDVKRAEELAIYAYYFLVIGVAIRFFELTLPENIQKQLSQLKTRISSYLNQPDYISFDIPNKDDIGRWLYFRMPRSYWAIHETKTRISGYFNQLTTKMIDMAIKLAGCMTEWFYVHIPRLYWSITEIKMRISGHIKQRAQGSINLELKSAGNIPDSLQNRRKRLPQTGFEKNLALISDISINIAIFLSLFLFISLVYGLMIDWWFVQRYLSNLVLIILGFLGLRILIRLGF
ncbi:MAG TPA: hypothetical protein VIO58_07925 [Candidatus Methanoperedens sp.]